MSRITLSVVVQRCNRYGRQATFLRFLEYLNTRSVQAAVREDHHDIPAANRLILKKDGSVSFPSFQPKKPFCAPGSNHVGPHQPHIHEGTKPWECAVTRKHVLRGQDGMPAAE